MSNAPGTLDAAPFFVVAFVSCVLCLLGEVARYSGMRRLSIACYLLTIGLCVGASALSIYYAQASQ